MPRLIRSASLAVLAAGLSASFAADGVPYSQATVTRLQNSVAFGMSAERARRPAQTVAEYGRHGCFATLNDFDQGREQSETHAVAVAQLDALPSR